MVVGGLLDFVRKFAASNCAASEFFGLLRLREPTRTSMQTMKVEMRVTLQVMLENSDVRNCILKNLTPAEAERCLGGASSAAREAVGACEHWRWSSVGNASVHRSISVH